MVVVGRPCFVCTSSISSRKLGRACAACERQFHRACQPDARTCPNCHQDLKASAAQARAARDDEARQTITQGRRLLWIGTVVILGTQLAINIFLIARGDDAQLGRSVVRLGLSVLAIALIHQGSRKAASAMLLLMGLAGALWVGLALLAPSLWIGAPMGAMGLTLLSTALVLALSPDFWRYLEHLRQAREVPPS